ncbi:threonine aldolase [bacterium]|nr:threonine aldolase [bacterium]
MQNHRGEPIKFDRRQFGSDNYSGICPEAWEAMQQVNSGHAPAYGGDEWTRLAADGLREFFACDCEIFFTFNGTAANSMAVASVCRSYHSIICADSSHMETDECGAPEFFSNGTKVLVVPNEHGKVVLREVEKAILKRDDIHYPKPHVLSLTQATEFGTVYTAEEIQAACDLAGKYNLRVHMDGARFANALAYLDVPPKAITWEAGVDVLCFGGTKNGMAVGEAVVFFDLDLAQEFDYRCKQAGQLCSKMRFIAGPWIGMLKDQALLKHARHANQCAQILHEKIKDLPGIHIVHEPEANSVFFKMSERDIEALSARGWHFYTFIGSGGCRFMCSWDTTEDDIDALVSDIKLVMNAS